MARLGTFCEDHNTPELYVMNRLHPAETAAFEEHLLTCPRCLVRVEEADEYVMLFRAAALEL